MICFAFKLEIPWIIGTASTWELADTVLSAVTYLEGGGLPNQTPSRKERAEWVIEKYRLILDFVKKPFWPQTTQDCFSLYLVSTT